MSHPAGSLADEVATAAAFRLRLVDRRFRGRAGARRGHQSGSSLEFFDFRDYVPGDDLRHIDWRGYARSEQLRVRLHEEEVAPFVDIVVDPSASMAVTAQKERAVQALVLALLHWSQQEGASARVLLLGGGQIAASELRCSAPAAPPLPPQVPLRRAGARVLITDGLWPEDPSPLLHALLGGSTRMVCLQVLDPWELAPPVGSALTLVDCESQARAELLLDARVVAGYRTRLQRLCEGLSGLVTAGGGVYVQVAADSLAVMCARDLLPAGVVGPA